MKGERQETQKSEVGGQKSDIRNRKSEINQKEICDPARHIRRLTSDV